jgi:hypothetical protein
MQITGKYNFQELIEIGVMMQIEPRLILGGSFIMSHQCFNSFAIV